MMAAYTFDGCETPTAEVAGLSPYALAVTLLDPSSQNLVTVQISVELGGVIRAVPHTSLLEGIRPALCPLNHHHVTNVLVRPLPEHQPFSSEYITELLSKSLSIPLTLKHLLHGKRGLTKS